MFQVTKLLKPLLLLVILKECSGNSCANKENCNECIKVYECAWCTKVRNENSTEHCFYKSKINDICDSENIINPQSKLDILENKPININLGSADIVKISPQHVQLNMRKGEEYVIEFEYGQSRNFPVDLYYIMDMSASLKADKANLARIAVDLINSMKEVTNDFKIGFGSFVDKPDAPFISTKPQQIDKPCDGCVRAYSFKNHLRLTNNARQFQTEVENAQSSGNLDVPEGGFDALMQAMVCTEEIGWRNQSTHIIVFTTDASFHVAGDGKLAGVVIPNDAKCHMANHFYTESLTYDYPSVSHINHIAKSKHVNILFAVKDKVKNLYKTLETPIENSKAVSLNHQDIIKQIQVFYQEISTTVKMTANSTQDVHVSFEVDCEGTNKFVESEKCYNVTADTLIKFKAKIKADTCFDHEIIRIKPNNKDAVLQIEVKADCQCDCGVVKLNAEECKSHGDLKCGICECHRGFNGQHCECDKSKNEDFDLSDQCKMYNHTEICSGRGNCLCNVCKCKKDTNPARKISGKFCECDNFSCPSLNGLCSNNGECECGECKCKAGYSGNACECKNDDSKCTRDNQICNNHGSCVCGKCQCEEDYFGNFCEECPTCFGGKCDELKPCVECKVHNKGPYVNDCDIKCARYVINIVDKVEENEIKTCYSYEKNCKMVFGYKYENDNIITYADKELYCSKPLNVVVLCLSIIGGIILIGLLTLIAWKVWTNYHDKIEYGKFLEEEQKQKWDRGENPLFISPVTKFQNPTYRRQSRMSKNPK